MNFLMASMPIQNRAPCATHRIAYEIQPSADSPRNECSSSPAEAGMNFRKMMLSDCAARNVCTPYQAIAMRPRMIAGTFAPSTPNTARLITGYGTPVRWEGLATRLAKTWTIRMPTTRAMSTCQLAMPSAKSEPAVT